MTENLALPLANGVGVEASYGTTTESSISTFTYTPTSAAMNGNTKTGTGSYSSYWYYNWLAATAEKGTASTAVGVDVNGSICPKGWRLPANYSYNPGLSYGALTSAYLGFATNTDNTNGYLTLESSPPSFQRSGIYINGSFDGAGTDYIGWASTSYDESAANALYYLNSIVYPQSRHTKTGNGLAIRCLAVR